MSAQHAPGPWVIDNRPTYAADAGMDAQPIRKGACVADVSTGFGTHSVHAPATIGRKCPSVAEMDEQGLANALLIAAAPDMLAALKALLLPDGEPGIGEWWGLPEDEQHERIRAAIAKAEGR